MLRCAAVRRPSSETQLCALQRRRFLLEIGGTSAEGASVERRRREDRGAEGAEGCRVWGGVSPFSIFELKKTRFGAFWV